MRISVFYGGRGKADFRMGKGLESGNCIKPGMVLIVIIRASQKTAELSSGIK